MIVNDLKTVAPRLLEERHPVYSILDEFGVFAGPQVTDLINKSREAGFHNVLSSQELADLRVDGSDVLMKQVFGNTNIIIHRQDVPDSAEFISQSVGTEQSFATTFQVNGDSETGAGTVKRDRSFIVHPNKIKRLSTGTAILFKKTPSFLVSNIAVRMVKILVDVTIVYVVNKLISVHSDCFYLFYLTAAALKRAKDFIFIAFFLLIS